MEFFEHFASTNTTKIGKNLELDVKKLEFGYMKKLFPNTDIDILEIGPGKGMLAELFLHDGYSNYDVIEPNKNMREILKKKKVRKAYNAMVPPINVSSKYDLIIASDIFEHLNDTKDATLFMEGVYNVLKKNGCIVIISPDILDWKMDFWNCDYTHSNPTSIRRTYQMFQNIGLKVEDYKLYYSKFSGLFGWLISRIIKIVTTFVKGKTTSSKLYKIRLAFSRRFWIVGRRTE